MKKIINCCGNCPFLYSDYDDFAIGDSTVEVCTLAKFQDLEEYYVLFHDGDGEINTPEWCPLKAEEHTFDFREFSKERQEKIDSTSKELEELITYINERAIDCEDEDEYERKSERVSELYSIMSDLHQNEEFFEDEFVKDINKNVSDITEQLNKLEEAAIKMNDTFNNLDNESN